ncbi:two-component system CitB family sensor kinase [Cryobacterium sp. MP_M5]|uniref:sensor histidine kinase n=1 Tax=unclassified Cryobacterium TaxID=2649013 RepID=UPI001A2658B9|nr:MULTISPECIES: ATP-binding protein [unclassified Cryobacterium]MBG6058917.1 sensor histidine kinase regulating citrate/malate metabolism [Cryobacterium sp. MP_M3]MEC5177074.1 two-component system CitB family sensor kinase [Cryobacterium sp. MP_M5]
MRSTAARGAARGLAAGPPRPRLSLTRQLLVFQLSLLAIVLVAVTAISLEQTRTTFESMQQRRMLAVAEYAAANPLLRSILSVGSNAGAGSDAGAGTDPAESRPQRLAAPVETLRTTTGVDELLVTDAIGRVLASPADPRLLGGSLRLEGPRPASDGSWSGVAPLGTVSHVVARVPVLDNAGRLVGMIVAGRQVPAFAGLLATAAPNLLTYLGVAGVLGLAGSWWLAARVKRQTLGLEPEQIARLVEHREAMLHGIREGVVAVDADGTITLANDSARTLLGLPDDAEGRSIDAVGLGPDAVAALRAHGTNDRDTALVNDGVLLVLNQTTIRLPRSRPEVVTTLRDRTELVTLQRDLGSSQQATDTLRAQTHEFANRLHTISMLMQLGDSDAAVDYIDAVTRDRTELDRDVLARIEEPAVAAVLIAKTSLARERGADLTLSPAARLPRVDAGLSTDLVTVIGNLVDNALDAVTGARTRTVTVDIRLTGADAPGPAAVRVRVHDSGPGVESALQGRVFDVGVTSKTPAQNGADHGYGLAIVRLVAGRRGGRVDYENANGTVFEAVLPLTAEPARPDREASHV